MCQRGGTIVKRIKYSTVERVSTKMQVYKLHLCIYKMHLDY